MNELKQFLIYIGITPEKQGFNYLILAVEEVQGKAHANLSKAYNKISLKTGVNVCTLDSSIRNAIHFAYDSGKLKRLNLKIGFEFIGDRCPTNKELVSILSYCKENKFFDTIEDNIIFHEAS